MTFLVPFIVQSCKRILTTDPELLGRMRHSGFQMVYLSQTRFFLKKSLIKLQCTISPIYCAKFLKKLLAPIQSFEDVPFLGPKCPICPNKKSLVKTINITLIYLLASFSVQNFKKISVDPELWGSAILGSKMVHLPQTRTTNWLFSLCRILKNSYIRMCHFRTQNGPNEIFSRKPVNKPCFYHSCLSTFQKSKSNINLLMKYY